MQYLSNIRIIWISHAHLDHYGELPLLITQIYKHRRKESNCCLCHESNLNYSHNCKKDPSKSMNAPLCQTCGQYLPPLVIAPPKVLHYLDLSIDCKNGIQKSGHPVRHYFGISNRDFDQSPFAGHIRHDIFTHELRKNTLETYRPISFVKSVPVEHCPNAHALILGLIIPGRGGTHDNIFNFCYSGDTRPSRNLVSTCNYLNRNIQSNISFLLHEATFDDDEKGVNEATKKKHSTVKEAIDIADKVSAKATLLTHFSQRYPKVPPGFEVPIDITGNQPSRKVGFAFDGMMIPMDDSILPSLIPQLASVTVQLFLL